jgi:uncharacterized RDD family membrane protein YckC
MEILDPCDTGPKVLKYAGFWIRAGAMLIDLIVIGVSFFLAMLLAIYFFMVYDIMEAKIAFVISRSIWATWAVLAIFYFASMESSSEQATLGKIAFRIKVGKSNGGKISFANAIGRYFSKMLSGMILYIGYIMVGFDEKKQGLHDKIANTYVFFK